MSTETDGVAAARSWNARRRVRLLAVLGAAVAVAAGVALFVVLRGPQPARGRVSLRELLGHVTVVGGWILFLLGSLEQLGAAPPRHSSLRARGRAGQRRALRQLRGRVPVSEDEVALVRYAGVARLARLRAARLSFPGLGLVFVGELVAAQDLLAAVLSTVLVVALLVGVLLVRREARRMRAFLAAHPGVVS